MSGPTDAGPANPTGPDGGPDGGADAAPQPAPELEGGTWLSGDPLRIAGRGAPVLLEFWEYTSANCMRTRPYLAEWHRRYAAAGLAVVGVHTPEFSFSRQAEHVRRAVAEEGIPYPVVHDREYAIWRAYQNRYWPARYFIDARGMLRAAHFGEGAYQESELLIQSLLQEAGRAPADLPEPMAPLRPEEAPGAVPYLVTQQVRCGYDRGAIGNPTAIAADRPHRYRDPGHHVEGVPYLDGDWIVGRESLARPFGATGAAELRLAYLAGDVHAVLHPPAAGGAGRLEVELDGAPLRGPLAGADVVDGAVTVDRPRLYRLVTAPEIGRHELTLRTTDDGLALFGITFGSQAAPAAPGASGARGA